MSAFQKRGVFKCAISFGLFIEEFNGDVDNEQYRYDHINGRSERAERNIPKFIKNIDDVADMVELFETFIHDNNNKINLNTKRRIIALTHFVAVGYHINLLGGFKNDDFPEELLKTDGKLITYPYENNLGFGF